jgi:hypothetical protein
MVSPHYDDQQSRHGGQRQQRKQRDGDEAKELDVLLRAGHALSAGLDALGDKAGIKEVMVDRRQQATASGSANFAALASKGKRPIGRIRTRGKIAMRWYQHRTQGAKPITSLKKRLPSVDALATIQQANRRFQSR